MSIIPKFGTKLHMQFSYDVWQAPQVTQSLEIHRLEPCYHLYAPENHFFTATRLIIVEMTQQGIARVPESGTRMGIEPYSFPSNFYDKRDARDLWINQWTPRSRVDVAVRNLSDEGAPDAMRLLCKAQEFTETGWNQLHKPKFAPVCGDDFVWSNLDVFSRLMLGLHSLGVKMIEGQFQDYFTVAKFQFDAGWLRNMWDTSEMLRTLSEVELLEGAASA